MCSRVQRRKRPARSYSATKPRRIPSKSSIASIRQNDAAMPVVDGDVLETRSQARRGQEPVAGPALEGEIDARDLIEVVEDHQCRRVVDQRDPAGLQPAALLPAREQAE